MPVMPSIQVQQLYLTVHNGTAMLVTDLEGWAREERTGLFNYDTRYASTYEIGIEDLKPRFLTAEQPVYNCAVLTYTNPRFRAGGVTIDEYGLFMKVSRVLDDVLHESIEVTSYAPEPITFRLMVYLVPSFEDIFEVRDLKPVPPRVIQSRYDAALATLSSFFRDRWFSRRLEYQVVNADSEPQYSPNLLIFRVHLRPQQTWKAETLTRMTGDPLGPFASSTVISPSGASASPNILDPPSQNLTDRLQAAHAEVEEWVSLLPSIQTPNEVVQRAYDQSLRDLAALRVQKVGDEWYPAAGVPWYNCIFGRDALVTALQCLSLTCPFPRAILTRLAELQGTRVDVTSDEEPGKICHELRVGQLSLTGKIPFRPFYGTVDASLLYVMLLWETYRITGDRSLLEQFIGAAERCLCWAAEYGDIDDDGFIEYWRRGPQDFQNQAWKDAFDAVVYPDGRIVPDPIAIVEVQGYYYAALCCAARIYRILGHQAKVDDAERRAARLYQDFNNRFWLPEEEFYAYGLDPEKRPIRTIASNPGQLLWTGIVPVERSAHVAQRLMASDMFGGWGVRTLSRQTRAYAPVMYQRGSVWPHDNAIIAFGLKRCGHWQEANQIAEGIFAASGYFARGQLPELWVGLEREETFWPVLYPKANVPQAWAAGSVPMLLQGILGLEPDADQHRLLVTPTLPSWLNDITIRGLRVGDGTVDLRFAGEGTTTRVDVLHISGPITVERRSITAGRSEF